MGVSLWELRRAPGLKDVFRKEEQAGWIFEETSGSVQFKYNFLHPFWFCTAFWFFPDWCPCSVLCIISLLQRMRFMERRCWVLCGKLCSQFICTQLLTYQLCLPVLFLLVFLRGWLLLLKVREECSQIPLSSYSSCCSLTPQWEDPLNPWVRSPDFWVAAVTGVWHGFDVIKEIVLITHNK